MKDPAGAISSIYATLLGSLTYASKPVPFFTEEPWSTPPAHFVTLQNIEFSPDNDDARFRSIATVTLDIVTKHSGQNTRAAANDIADQILQALIPNTDLGDSSWQLWIREASSPGFIHSQNGPANINRKILIINNHIIQKA
jgi:hypothetical protein